MDKHLEELLQLGLIKEQVKQVLSMLEVVEAKRKEQHREHQHDHHNKDGKRIVPAHDQINHLVEIIHYPDHPPRTDSEEFKEIRRKFHEQGAKCWIDNGYCEGQLEIHHAVVEWASQNEIDWDKVQKDYGFDHCDHIRNMLPLCHKHHQGVGTGIHKISYPAWILQKYMRKDALELFEKAVQHLKDQGHEEHYVNHVSKKLLLNMSKAKELHEAHQKDSQAS